MELEDSLMDIRDFTYRNYEIKASRILTLFYTRFLEIPLLSRMDAVREYVVDDYETLAGRDLNEEEQQYFYDQFMAMYETRDIYVLYSRFLESIGMRPLPRVWYEKRMLRYEDVYPVLYLKYRLVQPAKRAGVKHLVIDEMQDYTPMQYQILAMLFPCKMTILGDKAQTMDEKQQDVLKFLPGILGKKLRKIVMNKSYRNTVEIAKYAAELAGITDLELFERHGKPVGTFNGHRYYVYNRDNITTWEEAKQYCESKGGYLATITSQEENAYVYSYLRDNFDYESAYFGFTDEEEDGNWEWENNEEVSYTNWHPGEPNGQDENEKHAMYYYKYLDGSWNDGNFEDDAWNGDGSFICEWGDYQERMDSPDEERQKMTSGERNIVLVLDASGSMSGDPMMQTRKAAKNFASTILKEDASIGVVAYSENAEKISDFSSDETHLTHTVEDIGSDGGTNMEAGLAEAKAMLDNSNAKKKIIVLMSDGEPNEGKQGEELINYAEQIKNDGILVYTLGFFESMEGSKSAAQYLMEKIASDGCHYEVANADDLVFFFGDVADQINGQKYIYIRIACPVEVSVTYKGESLNSAEEDQTVRTDFGTLTFEDNEDSSYEQENDRIKVLRLKEGADYDVQIVGTDRGKMNYTIGFMDENGDYSDFRYFDDIRVTQRTVIDTVATVSKESILKIDEDGDGKYEKKLRAKENGYGEEVKRSIWVYIAAGAGVVVSVAFCIVIVLDQRKHEKRRGKIPLK